MGGSEFIQCQCSPPRAFVGSMMWQAALKKEGGALAIRLRCILFAMPLQSLQQVLQYTAYTTYAAEQHGTGMGSQAFWLHCVLWDASQWVARSALSASFANQAFLLEVIK